MHTPLGLLVGICVLVFVFGDDKIIGLPYLQGTLGNQWSGYLEVNVTHGRYLHYWFIESAGNPEKDPLVLWLNGGPGCSSLDGFFYENGPYNWAPGPDNFSLIDNPNSWHKVANMLYLESPAGVGFSYTNTTSDYHTEDFQTATDNYIAIVQFLKLFPQFVGRPFYISGESYAGIYVPTLARQILQSNTSLINLQGILVGNGVSDEKYDNFYTSLAPFAYGHGIVGQVSWNKFQKACFPNPNTPACDAATLPFEENLSGIDIYNVIGDCYSQRPFLGRFMSTFPKKARYYGYPTEVPPCVDANKATVYLNLPEVKNAINVRKDIKWEICNAEINGFYHHDAGSMLPIYLSLLQAGKRALVYSGDVDGAVPFKGSEAWTESLGFTPKVYWKPWQNNDDEGVQVAGYKTDYGNGLIFVTVRGAGHMVPQYKPEAAFAMFSRFIQAKNI